jgi:hypothetical protein
MLDLTGILFSSVMMIMVIMRALQLDRSQPWFQKIKRHEDVKPDKQPVRRRSF